MRGLIVKDFYNMGKHIGPTLVTAGCVGLLLMVQGSPALFVIGFAIAGGGLCSTCLRMDEAAGWTRFELTAPVGRAAVVLEKYLLLFLLTAAGLVVGGAVSGVAAAVTGTLDFTALLLYSSVAFSISVISGSLILFFLFRFGMMKADFFTVLCYAVPAGLFVAALAAAKAFGFEVRTGPLCTGITCLFPLIALAAAALTAAASVAVYRKKQF